MACCSKRNISQAERFVRVALGAGIVGVAIVTKSYYLLPVAIALFAAAYKQYCFVYDLLGINDNLAKRNHYAALLPKYRNTPVLIFDKKASLLYKNEKADLLSIDNAHDLGFEDVEQLVTNAQRGKIYYKIGNRHYQLDYVGIQEEGLLLVYFNDVTEMVRLSEEIESTQREIIYTMGEIGETRSKETGNHVKRVAHYSKELALLYGLNEQEAEILYTASPMHDIGKVGIPDAILLKPGKLTSEEFAIMKTHAELGYEMLKHSSKPILKAAATVAREHHEKFDGSGYPRGIVGEDIHIFGRITAVADVFDALGSERVYKKAWELERILEFFKEQSGKHFDPVLVTLFLNNLERFTAIRDKFKDV